MADFLKFLGAIVIAAGLLGGMFLLGSFDWQGYEIAQSVARNLPDNQVAQADVDQFRNLLIVYSGYTGALVIGGLVSGGIILGLSVIIDQLDEQISRATVIQAELEKLNTPPPQQQIS